MAPVSFSALATHGFDQVDQNLNPLHGIRPETERTPALAGIILAAAPPVGNDPIDIILGIKCGAHHVDLVKHTDHRAKRIDPVLRSEEWAPFP